MEMRKKRDQGQRWTQKTLVTKMQRQRGQPSEKKDRQEQRKPGSEKGAHVASLDHPPAGVVLLGPPLCPGEPFSFLVAIMKMLVCPAEALGCFQLELSVVGFEAGPSVGTAVFRLQRLLDALGSRLWVIGQGSCLPCGGHPQRPVPHFLAKPLELLQEACVENFK